MRRELPLHLGKNARQWNIPEATSLKQQRDAESNLLSDLKSCSLRRDLHWGRRIHASTIGSHNNTNSYVVTALIRMYAKCSSIVEAHRVFDNVPNPSVASWNALLMGYAENGDGVSTLDLFSRMKAHGCVPSSVTYVAAVKACTILASTGDTSRKRRWLECGREIHAETGSRLDLYVQSALIDMYAKCSSMVDARHVFDSIEKPDVVSWNALLLGYVENGNAQVVLDLVPKMKEHGCRPDPITYIAALKACSFLAVNADGSGREECLRRGRDIHQEIGCILNRRLQNTLIDMYAKCGSMVDARQVFGSIQNPDVVSWNALLLGYADNGAGHVALDLFSQMKARGVPPDKVTYVAALKACKFLGMADDGRSLERGKQVHSEIGCHMDQCVQSALIDMYVKCGSTVDARRVFDSIQNPDVVSWTNLLLGYAEHGEGHAALELLSRMKARGCVPDSVTYVATLKACASLALNADKQACLQRGRLIHMEIGCRLDHSLLNMLIDMYAKCGSMAEARCVFDSIQTPDVVSWTALLLGYAENGEARVTLELVSRMRASGCVPNSVTYVASLKACCLTGDLALGRKFHSEISEFTAPLVTCLIDLYAKCGSVVEAREVFEIHSATRSISAWNALLAGYSSFGDSDSVFSLVEAMKDEGFQPDGVTLVSVLLCCSHAGLVEKARESFDAIILQTGITPTIMHYTCMIDVLGRANQLNEAIALFRKMPCNPDAVIWTTLFDACCKWKNVEIGRIALESTKLVEK